MHKGSTIPTASSKSSGTPVCRRDDTHISKTLYDVNPPSIDVRLRLSMNDGDVPSVPVTTLAGLSCLSELLPQLPLPRNTSTSGSKNLLFHPRVEEEANNLLVAKDANLVPLLDQLISQTSSDDIMVKRKYEFIKYVPPSKNDDVHHRPQLLSSILYRNDEVFRGQLALAPDDSWSKHQQQLAVTLEKQMQHNSQYPQTTVSQSYQLAASLAASKSSNVNMHPQFAPPQAHTSHFQTPNQPVIRAHSNVKLDTNISQLQQNNLPAHQQNTVSHHRENIQPHHHNLVPHQQRNLSQHQQLNHPSNQQRSILQNSPNAAAGQLQQSNIQQRNTQQLNLQQQRQHFNILEHHLQRVQESNSAMENHHPANNQRMRDPSFGNQCQPNSVITSAKRNIEPPTPSNQPRIQHTSQVQRVPSNHQALSNEPTMRDQLSHRQQQQQRFQQELYQEDGEYQNQVRQARYQQAQQQQQQLLQRDTPSNQLRSESSNTSVATYPIIQQSPNAQSPAYITQANYLPLSYDSGQHPTTLRMTGMDQASSVDTSPLPGLVTSRYTDASVSSRAESYSPSYVSHTIPQILHGITGKISQPASFNSYDLQSSNEYLYHANMIQSPYMDVSGATSDASCSPGSSSPYLPRISTQVPSRNGEYTLPPAIEKYLVASNVNIIPTDDSHLRKESPIVVAQNERDIYHPSVIQMNAVVQNDLYSSQPHVPNSESRPAFSNEERLVTDFTKDMHDTSDLRTRQREFGTQSGAPIVSEAVKYEPSVVEVPPVTTEITLVMPDVFPPSQEVTQNITLITHQVTPVTVQETSLVKMPAVFSVETISQANMPVVTSPSTSVITSVSNASTMSNVPVFSSQSCANNLSVAMMRPIISLPLINPALIAISTQVYLVSSTSKFSDDKENKKVIKDGSSDVDIDNEKQKFTKDYQIRKKERGFENTSVKEECEIKTEDDEEYNVSLTERIKNRKRSNRIPDLPEPAEYIPKPKIRKFERKLVPVLEKLSVDDLMETNTYSKFSRTIEKVFEQLEDADLTCNLDDDSDEDDDCDPGVKVPRAMLQDLYVESAKLKSLGCMESVPSDCLVRLLGILEKNINGGCKVSPLGDPDDDECERKLWMDLVMERVTRAAEASLITLYILTSPSMQKKVYLEDVIDRVIVFAKYQLCNTVYPAFDPIYKPSNTKGMTAGVRKKRAPPKEMREKKLMSLYMKLVEIISLISELISIQKLTDNAVLHLSTLGVGPFFVENVNELQLSALKLVTTIFAKYEKHRKLLLDDILASMARLPSTKNNLRTFKLNANENIQMISALVLQLIQSTVALPNNLSTKMSESDADKLITNKFRMAQALSSNFLTLFLGKCSGKHEETDYRVLFENFVQDLLSTVNKPEWPVSELLLSCLGKILCYNFVNKGTEMTLRVASLDYLGVVAARLRRDTVSSNLKLSTIDAIIHDVRSEEKRQECDDDQEIEEIKSDEERIKYLQKILLDYLFVKSNTDETVTHARHFYITQWYQDAVAQLTAMNKRLQPKAPKGKYKEESEESEDSDKESRKKIEVEQKCKVMEESKQFYLSKINPYPNSSAYKVQNHIESQYMYIDYDSAQWVVRYLASKRPFAKSFDLFMKQILMVLSESSVIIRTKAMKCLSLIVEVDANVLATKEMQSGVSFSLTDHSTSVREAAVDLVGKYVLSDKNLIDKYYDMLSLRILDTGVSVRKRVIKILKDICLEYPDYPKIPEICVKMIKRVNDEEGIKKLVMEVFQNMWFTPVAVSKGSVVDCKRVQLKVENITRVVSACCKDIGLDWLEQLLATLFKPKEDREDSTRVVLEPPKALTIACQQICDCLVENVITLESTEDNSRQRLVSCMYTLFLFTKTRPQLVVHHAIKLQPYLSIKCKTVSDYIIIGNVARILEIVVPMLEHPSEQFLSQIEEDTIKLILEQEFSIIFYCVSCLSSVVNNVTHNYTLIHDCFTKLYQFLKRFKLQLEAKENQTYKELVTDKNINDIQRSMHIIGLMLRFFDFKDGTIFDDETKGTICDDVFRVISYFLHVNDDETRLYALRAIGSMCIRHYDYMLGEELMAHYRYLLRDDSSHAMKNQVLTNICSYLQEEQSRMIKLDEHWEEMAKKENLKEMGDVTSGMASTVVQVYLKDILESYLSPSNQVRQSSLNVIRIILSQGLVHPVQIVPYLICMGTDNEKTVSVCADSQLQDIEKKYPGFIHMKALLGIKLSFEFQKIMQNSRIVRGYREVANEIPAAMNGFLYSILRGKTYRRGLIISLLKKFEEQNDSDLSHLLYLADNIAYFPYQVIDEPLFIIHHINVMISVTGTNLLQSFKEELLPDPSRATTKSHLDFQTQSVFDDDDEDVDNLLLRLPENTKVLSDCMIASQGCIMLLILKQHLKSLYGLTDAKINSYSPSESAKVNDKSLNRKNISTKFTPKSALQKLQKDGDSGEVLTEDDKRQLISEFLEFKQLILSLDREDEVDDEDDDTANRSNRHAAPLLNISQQNDPSQETSLALISDTGTSVLTDTSSSECPRIPKLTIKPPRPPSESDASMVNHRKHKSHKKKSKKHRHHRRGDHHHHKRKKKRRSSRSDEESDDDDDDQSDPDFQV